jgi:hypothetical protein
VPPAPTCAIQAMEHEQQPNILIRIYSGSGSNEIDKKEELLISIL